MIPDYFSVPKEDVRHRRVPAYLLGASVAVVVGKKLVRGEMLDAVSEFGWLFIFVIIAVPISGFACLLTRKLLSANFGDAKSAILKLAAIFMVQIAMGSLLPDSWSKWTELFSSFVYFSLLLWLFDLEIVAGAVFTIILVLIRVGIAHLLMGRSLPLV